MNKIYEHKLERTAANFTFGSFGGVKDKDLICVQSMDGTISIFESENFIFMRFIPGFAMPGPLAYCASTDSFLTVSSNRCLESYSYQGLAVAASSKTKEESQNTTAGKRIKADWQLCLGECALDIKIVNLPNGSSLIMVLGERNLFCVKESGQIKYMKKLEYSPACFHPYVLPDSSIVNCIISTHSKQLLVYEGIILKWATLIDDVPVQVAIGNIGGVEGMIVSLSDNCKVSCAFLGTHPSIFSLPRSASREIDQLTIGKEMRVVNDKIRHLHSSKGDLLSRNRDSDDLKVKIDMPQTIDRVSVGGQHAPASTEGPVPSVTAQIMLKALKRVTNISVMIHVDEPLSCTQRHITIPAVAESDPTPCITVSFFLGKEFSPASLSVDVIVHYQQSGSGNPRVVSTKAELPLSLVSWPLDPIKTMQCKVTLESNVHCLNLLELFPELGSADAGPHCVGLKLIHGAKTTILTSKSSNRYRVQGESYAALWLIAKELLKRIQKHAPSCIITHPQPVNIDEISPVMDRHFQLRMSKLSVQQLLDHRARQFRAIQRRLLTRFKDKTPRPLNCLDTLLEGTYRQIQALGDACEENTYMLLMSNVELLSVLRLTILLFKFWLGLPDKECQFLEAALCINLRDADMGWEETIESSVAAILSTLQSKGGKGDGYNASANSMTPQIPNDVSKLKELVRKLFDWLSKGARIAPSSHKHDESGTGPISNITIGHSSVRADQRFRSPATTRGGSDDEIIHDEEEDALIADIMKSTPVSYVSKNAPSDKLKPPSEFQLNEQQGDGSSATIDTKASDLPDIESSISNLSLRTSNSKHGNDLGLQAGEEPVTLLLEPIKPLPELKEDRYGVDEDIMESSSFFDSTSDDTYAM